jgi:peroxiredoxin
MRALFVWVFSLGLVAFASDVPRPAPEISLRMPQGEDLKISSFLGKVVALEYLLTTCEHCQRCSQTLNRLHRELGSQGFQPVGAAVNENALIMVPDYVRQFNLNFPVGFAQREDVIRVLRHPIMQPLAFPNVLIIDRNGVIRHQFKGSDPLFDNEEKNMRDLIVPLLKEKATKPAKKK